MTHSYWLRSTPLLAGMLIYWACLILLFTYWYSALLFLTPATAFVSALVDALSLLAIWLAAAAVATRLPLYGSEWGRNLLLTTVIALCLLVLRIVVLRAALMPLGWFDELTLWSSITTMGPRNLLTFGVFWMGGWAVTHYRQGAQLALSAATLRLHLSEARLSMLRSRLQPHFVGNALNALAVLATETPLAARAMLQHLRDVIVSAEEHAEDAEVRVRDEIDFVQRWLQVQKVRFGDRLVWTIDVEPAAADAWIPSLGLQLLAENVVKHAIGESPDVVHLRMSARVRQQRVQITVEDDGPGLGSARLTWGVGIGGTRARLALLHGDEAALTVAENADGGVTASMSLPLRYHPAHAASAEAPPRTARAARPGSLDAFAVHRTPVPRAVLFSWLGIVILAMAFKVALVTRESPLEFSRQFLAALIESSETVLLCVAAFHLPAHRALRRFSLRRRVLCSAALLGVACLLLEPAVSLLLSIVDGRDAPSLLLTLAYRVGLWLLVLNALLAGIVARDLARRSEELIRLRDQEAEMLVAQRMRLRSRLNLDELRASFDRIDDAIGRDSATVEAELDWLSRRISRSLAYAS